MLSTTAFVASKIYPARNLDLNIVPLSKLYNGRVLFVNQTSWVKLNIPFQENTQVYKFLTIPTKRFAIIYLSYKRVMAYFMPSLRYLMLSTNNILRMI